MEIKSEQEMINFGKHFADSIAERVTSPEGASRENLQQERKRRQDPPHATVIELIGDVGTGKTTFVRGLAQGLGIKSSVTSPSFTISKSYALPTGGYLIHYDFYRLPNPGLMAEDLQENLTNPHNIIVIEWGESLINILPKNRIKINFAYHNQGRTVTL